MNFHFYHIHPRIIFWPSLNNGTKYFIHNISRIFTFNAVPDSTTFRYFRRHFLVRSFCRRQRNWCLKSPLINVAFMQNNIRTEPKCMPGEFVPKKTTDFSALQHICISAIRFPYDHMSVSLCVRTCRNILCVTSTFILFSIFFLETCLRLQLHSLCIYF